MTTREPGPLQASRPPVVMIRVVNPVVRYVLGTTRHAVLSDRLLVLHVRGRRTGRRYDIPVGYHLLGGVHHVLTHSRWRHNLGRDTPVELTYRGARREAFAQLIEDPEQVAALYGALLARDGPRGMRRLGLHQPGGGVPDVSMLREAVGRLGLTAIRLDLESAGGWSE